MEPPYVHAPNCESNTSPCIRLWLCGRCVIKVSYSVKSSFQDETVLSFQSIDLMLRRVTITTVSRDKDVLAGKATVPESATVTM